jgi:hypothetical protein
MFLQAEVIFASDKVTQLNIRLLQPPHRRLRHDYRCVKTNPERMFRCLHEYVRIFRNIEWEKFRPQKTSLESAAAVSILFPYQEGYKRYNSVNSLQSLCNEKVLEEIGRVSFVLLTRKPICDGFRFDYPLKAYFVDKVTVRSIVSCL